MSTGESQRVVGRNGKCKGPRALAAAMIAAVILSALGGCTAKSANSPDQSITTATDVTLTPTQRKQIHLYSAAQSSFTRTIEANAVVDYDQEQATAVLAPISGPVSRLLVTVGARVKAGAALASVTSPDFAAAISAYRKALATAQTARKLADMDADLVQHHGVAPREAAQAQTDAANAEADSDAALQALMSLRVDPQTIKAIQQGHTPADAADGLIRAPIAGTVVERLITPGQLLEAATTPCFTVADLSRVWVMAQVFGEDIGAVRQGDPAEVRTGNAEQVLSGTVTNVAAIVDPNTRAVAARVTVNNPGEVLKRQMYLRVLIHSRQQETGMLIPVSAVLRDDENLPFVYVSQPDGRFARQRVTLGPRIANQYDIIEGLHIGDPVVIEGAIFLQFIQNQ
jgi:cobalt-zinc-cadmium efflux system membrane fusion protein